MDGETRLAVTARTRLHRFPVRGKFVRQTIHAILDSSRCTVGASLEAEWRPHISRWVPQGLACSNESVDEHFRPTGICDGLAEGFRTIALRDCIGDRVPGAVAWNLLDACSLPGLVDRDFSADSGPWYARGLAGGAREKRL